MEIQGNTLRLVKRALLSHINYCSMVEGKRETETTKELEETDKFLKDVDAVIKREDALSGIEN